MNTIHRLFASAAAITLSTAVTTRSATAQVVPLGPPTVNLPTDFYPPPNGILTTLPNAPATNYGSVLIRNWSYTGSQKAGPLAGISAAQIAQVKHTASFEISTDGGQTWKPHSAPATGELKLSPVVDGGTDIFNNELWSMTISGGTLPPGMMIRESPSKASTGKTTLALQPDGTCDMSSWFDVFTEVSLNGGQSWLTPAGGASQHLELVLEMEESFFRSNFLPLTAELSSGPLARTTFGAGPGGLQPVIIERLARPAVGAPNRMPPPGPGQNRVFSSTQPVTFMLSLNGGQSFTSVEATATSSQRVTNNSPGPGGGFTFDTEMLQLNIQGGDLPQGMLIRESPTLASIGKTSIRTVPGGFRIGSFFDIFTELSTDGGQTWRPALESTRLTETAHSQPVVVDAPPGVSLSDLRILSSLATDPGGLPARTAGGVIAIESIEMACEPFNAMHPPPAAGAQVNDIPFGFLIRYRQEFGPQQMTRRKGLPPAGFVPRPMSAVGTQTFDTEMLSFSLIPIDSVEAVGIMFRESPTRASTGLLTLTSPPGGNFKIDSYFDVFFEVSLDGGQTWLPTDRPLRLTVQPPVTNVTMPGPTLPPSLTEPTESYFQGLVWAGGNVVSDISACAQAALGSLPGQGQQKTFNFNGSASLTSPLFSYKTCAVRQEMSAFFLRHTGDSGPSRYFDTEMLSLNITGGGLPAGYMIRESPTLASVGKLTSTQLPNGTFRIGSWFDVFTELSLDGGTTWQPSDGPVRLDMTQPRQAIITGPGGGSASPVRMFSGGGLPLLDFSAGQENFQGGVRVATGDVNGDGVAEIITASGPGGSPSQVRISENANGVLVGLTSRDSSRLFQPFGNNYTGGVNVAAGDVNGDGRADIIVGADSGGQVKAFDMTKLTVIRSFLPYSGFTGGVTVAAGDVNGDGRADIITGAAAGGGPHVKVFDGNTGAEIRSFLAFAGFNGGVNVAAGDVNGDGFADIVTGAGAGGGPHVKVFDGNTGAELLSFFAFDAGFAGGVNVATGDLDGDGQFDVIIGAKAAAPGGHVKAFSGNDGSLMSSFFAYDPSFNGGVFVAGMPPVTLNAVPIDADCDGLPDDWEITHWRSTGEHDGMDDSDHDGTPAVAELAFGMDPNKPDIAGLPEVRAENSYLTMHITKRPGVIYEVQSGDSFGSPGMSAGETTVLVNDLNTLVVRDNVAIRVGSRRFMHAVVTGAP